MNRGRLTKVGAVLNDSRKPTGDELQNITYIFYIFHKNYEQISRANEFIKPKNKMVVDRSLKDLVVQL